MIPCASSFPIISSLQEVINAPFLLPASDTILFVDIDETLIATPARREETPLLDPQSPLHIEQLKKIHSLVFGFTAARGREDSSIEGQMPELRFKHLEKLGITFSASEPLSFSYHPTRRTWAVFEKGILYSDQRDKGDILHEFLTQITWKVSHIVFVDDNIWNLLSVQQVAAKHEISFTGFLYQQPKPPPEEIEVLLKDALKDNDWKN